MRRRAEAHPIKKIVVRKMNQKLPVGANPPRKRVTRFCIQYGQWALVAVSFPLLLRWDSTIVPGTLALDSRSCRRPCRTLQLNDSRLSIHVPRHQRPDFSDRVKGLNMATRDNEEELLPLSGAQLMTEPSSRRVVLIGSLLSLGVLTGITEDAAASTNLAGPEMALDTRNPGPIPDMSWMPSNTLSEASTATPLDWHVIVDAASKKAFRGGKAGAAAAVVQVCSLMWLRTSMNYQYRYGGNLQSSLRELWADGGIGRLYQGLPFALMQGPLSRFGDTAANVGVLALLEGFEVTRNFPLPLKTACGSCAAGAWRIFLMPIDTCKTTLQVEGSTGLQTLIDRVSQQGPGPLYRGAVAQAAATAAGHFPWFVTYNGLNEYLPAVSSTDDLLASLLRSAFLGFCASSVSDCVSNSLRVVKTTKQTATRTKSGESGDDQTPQELSYPEVVAMIIQEDGIVGLLGRGLQTRLLTNAIQGALFSVLWRYFQDLITSSSS
jgi:Mitochondrial carrier protein